MAEAVAGVERMVWNGRCIGSRSGWWFEDWIPSDGERLEDRDV